MRTYIHFALMFLALGFALEVNASNGSGSSQDDYKLAKRRVHLFKQRPGLVRGGQENVRHAESEYRIGNGRHKYTAKAFQDQHSRTFDGQLLSHIKSTGHCPAEWPAKGSKRHLRASEY